MKKTDLAWVFMLAGLVSTGPLAAGTQGTVMEYDAGISPPFTVYRPRDLASAPSLPIVVWGNGACYANGGAQARPFLQELAAHGYLVMALGKPGPDPELRPLSDTEPSPELPPVPPGRDETDASELIAAIDWGIAENQRDGSIYKGRIATGKVAVMGHSCGGLQALSVQQDPRIDASMIWNSGIYDRPAGRIGVRPTKDQLAAIHAPILYAQGGPADIAYEAVNDDFSRLPADVPAVLIEANVGHAGTLDQPRGGRYAEIALAWLDWWLNGNREAAEMFIGEHCSLCEDPDWQISRRHLE